MRAFGFVVLAAVSLNSLSASSAPRSSLADFIPATLNGVALMKMPKEMGPPPPDAAGAYIDRKSGKSININLFRVKDLKTSKAQFHGLKPGETKDNPVVKLAFKGFEVSGIVGERTRYLGDARKSEAILLLADRLDVRVSVQPTDNEDDAIEIVLAERSRGPFVQVRISRTTVPLDSARGDRPEAERHFGQPSRGERLMKSRPSSSVSCAVTDRRAS